MKPGESTCIDNQDNQGHFSSYGRLEGYQNNTGKISGFITRVKMGLGSAEHKFSLFTIIPYLIQCILGSLLLFAVFQPIFANGYQQQLGHIPSYWTDYRLLAVLFIGIGLLPLARIIMALICPSRKTDIRLYYHATLNVSTLVMIIAVFAFLVLSTMGITKLPMLDQITVWILIAPITLVILKLIATVEEW